MSAANQEQKGEEAIKDAVTILRAGPICDDCLGRAFAKLGHGFSNRQRGGALRTLLSMLGVDGKPGTCWICDGLFDRVGDWAARAVAASKGIVRQAGLLSLRSSSKTAPLDLYGV
ncbi:hypothetical protein KAX17_00995 [Candidatus Bipolaricaulota bacterium]|nr:hypothetical protein [Candidatus Bipolaricaulota bacterium]